MNINMNASEFIVDYLIRLGVTDVFGIPGGVLLDLIYAFDDKKDTITPHLCYHEQSAGFAASGYAQACGKLGVAYATRGPGFTNMITAIADAYCDSTPVLFITAHSSKFLNRNMRVMYDQEIDTCSMVRNITKFSARIDDVNDIPSILNKACIIALDGRRGPVFLDFASDIFSKSITLNNIDKIPEKASIFDIKKMVYDVKNEIKEAKRPIILVGDGVNQVNLIDKFKLFINMAKIPVLSSRSSLNIVGDSNFYFGYVGSHGIRTANFIMSKADLVVAIGNRVDFPVHSESYFDITQKTKFLRFDIDPSEFERQIPNSTNYQLDIRDLLEELSENIFDYGNHSNWLSLCEDLKDNLKNEDINLAVERIADILKNIPEETTIVSDVGNNEFWLSRACILSRTRKRVLFSKSFGAMGCALGKSIGAYYATRKPLVCFTGDQGLLMDSQEFQTISQNNLPISVVLLNNKSSGMIRDREKYKFGTRYLHTTKDTGYGIPNFQKIIEGYGIIVSDYFDLSDKPLFHQILIDEDLSLTPRLPKGKPCQDLFPDLDRERYEYLNNL
ncbi:Acetolactate synthase isozyme 2 large subunit [bioreactor metagenome]|uniref:Acetolactate synthase isozyme 2 large subunit n=1 Tax=bioreactor metagenome TaxID=1076179 RepID=A0A644VQ65_9ZZZZ